MPLGGSVIATENEGPCVSVVAVVGMILSDAGYQ